MPTERRRRRERLTARRAPEACTAGACHSRCRELLELALAKQTLALTDRRVVVHVIPTQINLPRHTHVRIVDRGPGAAHAGADFAPEVHGAVGVVVRRQDPGAET